MICLIVIVLRVLVYSLFNLSIVEDQIKKLCSEDIIKTLDEEAISKMKEPIIDFLYRIKDKHPSSTSLLFVNFFLFYYSLENESFDVAHRVMKFMWDNKQKPSKALVKKYKKSKTTKNLNLFPSYEDWKKIWVFQFQYNRYDELKKAYRSKIIKN